MDVTGDERSVRVMTAVLWFSCRSETRCDIGLAADGTSAPVLPRAAVPAAAKHSTVLFGGSIEGGKT